MSSIKPSHVLFSALLALALGGCGDRNDRAVFSQESGHSSDWILAHKASARADVESCSECHGESYDGGVSKVSCMSTAAVSGFSCHATPPAANLTGCVSCHGGSPNGPFGTVAPNRKSAHVKHVALIGCDVCHPNGAGSAGHAKATAAGGLSSATVTLATTLKAKTLTAFGYDAATGKCSGVSCHGGITTPAWTGSISMVPDNNAVCLQCHEQGTQQYNSFNSGSYSGTGSVTNTHTSHLGRGAFCTDCHNIGSLTNYQKHFGKILSNTFTAPDSTIGGTPTKIGSYTVSSKTCSSFTCHPNLNPQWIQ